MLLAYIATIALVTSGSCFWELVYVESGHHCCGQVRQRLLLDIPKMQREDGKLYRVYLHNFDY